MYYCKNIKYFLAICRRRLEFTLIELMVVISIIAILITILLPAITRAKAMSHRIGCMNNLKQYGVAMHMYYSDFGDNCLVGYKHTPGNFWLDKERELKWDWPYNWDEIWKIYLNADEDVIYCPSQDPNVFGGVTGYSLVFSIGVFDSSPYYPGPGWIFYVNGQLERYGGLLSSGGSNAKCTMSKLQNSAVLVDNCGFPGTLWFNKGFKAHILGGTPTGQNCLYYNGAVKWHKINKETFWTSDELFPIVERNE